MAHFYSVKEMTDKVNDILNLLDKAKDLAYEVRIQNVKNYNMLNGNTEGVEKRPLSMEEMKIEAKKYIDVFAELREQIGNVEDFIARNY